MDIQTSKVVKEKPKSWAPVFELGGVWATNAQRFATFEEAHDSAARRFMRWTAPTSYGAHPSDDAVNYRFDPDRGDVLLDGDD